MKSGGQQFIFLKSIRFEGMDRGFFFKENRGGAERFYFETSTRDVSITKQRGQLLQLLPERFPPDLQEIGGAGLAPSGRILVQGTEGARENPSPSPAETGRISR
jgi:hypothetical protein